MNARAIRSGIVALLGIFLAAVPIASRAGPLEDFDKARRDLEAVKLDIRDAKRERVSLARPPISDEKQRQLSLLERRLDGLYARERRASFAAAQSLTVMMTVQSADPGTRQDLMRSYQAAKWYTDAGHCDQARPRLAYCRDHPRQLRQFRTAQGSRLDRLVAANERVCSPDRQNIDEEIHVDAKAAFIEEGLRPFLIDRRPYTMDEIESMHDRLVTLDEAAQMQVGKLLERLHIDSATQVLVEPPFLLVAGPGRLPDWALQTRKVLPGGESSNAELTSIKLETVFQSVVSPLWSTLRDTFFDRSAPEHMIPIYVAGGPLSTEGLLGWSAYCLEVHERRCGLSLGYYMAHDNSVVVWLSSGGGTLAHELVHALMAADFPDAPMWLDEGIASLHEVTEAGQPADNYRHYYIEESLSRFDGLIPIDSLVQIRSEDLTRPEGRNLYVAYMRSFAHFLHDEGVLPKVYQDVRALEARSAARQLAVIVQALGERDSASVDARWGEWAKERNVPSRWDYLRHGAYEDLAKFEHRPWQR